MKIVIRYREYPIIRCVKLYAAKYVNTDNFEYFSHDGKDHDLNLCLDIPVGETISFTYKENKITLLLSERDEYLRIGGYIDNYKELVVLGIEANKFVKEAVEYYETMYIAKLKPDKLNVLHFKYGQFWEIDAYCTKRNLNTVYLPEKTKNDLVMDLEKFNNNKNRYNELNIPYSRVYMLYGPPGTGKTSLLKSIASKFDKNVAVLDFDKDMNDKDLKRAFQTMPENSIVLLEDIDCLFDSRKSCDEFKNDVTFSAILNTLDGICEQDGLIMFITSNHLDKLDSALIRRIDYFIKFDYATKEQIKGIHNRFFSDQIEQFDDFFAQIKHVKMTINVLQKFFTRHLDSCITEKCNELCNFARGELCLDNLTSQRMYT
jgi:predicted AAA+ superfamily ATPase